MISVNNIAGQSALFDSELDTDSYFIQSFSANNFCTDSKRLALEKKYSQITEVSKKFDRKLVSFQLSKATPMHRWLKYKEGFSSDLVALLLEEMNLQPGNRVCDPFLGSGTTQVVAQIQGLSSIGFDVLPTSSLVAQVKNHIMNYSFSDLREFCQFVNSLVRPKNYCNRVNWVNITKNAYPTEIDYDLAYFTEKINESKYAISVKNIGILSILNSLERLSYTCKDGQYLRWDERSEKVITANKIRVDQGKPILKTILNKGEFPLAKDVIGSELEKIINDIDF